MIGDPRDTGERTLNTADTVADWAERIRGQLERFVDFDGSPTGAIVENNLSWTSALSAIEFLRDIGKHFSVNVMLDRDTIRRRLEGEGISYTEFSYMLLQANDYVQLHQRHGCVLQIGGSDQWGNIIAGVRLVRQKLGATVHALTVPLVTAADGNEVRQVHRRRQPLAGPGDDHPVRLVPVLRQHRRRRRHPVPAVVHLPVGRRVGRTGGGDTPAAHERAAQRRLARELTTLVHGERATDAVEHASQALFGRGELARSTSRRWRRRCGRPR